MTIENFIYKYVPDWDEEDKDILRRDLLELPSHQFQNTAIAVLSSIDGAELTMTQEADRSNASIIFGKGIVEEAKNGFEVSYSPATGLQESDWFMMLSMLAKTAVNL